MAAIVIRLYEIYKKEEIIPFYKEDAGLSLARDTKTLEMAYRNSLCVLGAYLSGKLVGILRAVGDGHSIVYVQELAVLPEYRMRLIGKRLVTEILNSYPDAVRIVLCTNNNEQMTLFYKKLIAYYAGSAEYSSRDIVVEREDK